MDRNTCKVLEKTLPNLIKILESHNEVLEGIISSDLDILQALQLLLDLLKSMLCLQISALLLLAMQLLAVLVYALCRILRAVMRWCCKT